MSDGAITGGGDWLVRAVMCWAPGAPCEYDAAEDIRSLAILTIAIIGRASRKKPTQDAESIPDFPAEFAKYTVENTTNNGEFET